MTVKTVISEKGVVDSSGGPSLNVTVPTTVDPNASHVGLSPYRTDGGASTSSPKSGAFTLTTPGFYWVSGSFECTGTLPVASSHPGAFFSLSTLVNGENSFMLTGSARSSNTSAVFTRNGAGAGSVSGSTGTVVGGGVVSGDKLTVPNSGSVGLFSDGKYWIPMASSGSLQIQA